MTNLEKQVISGHYCHCGIWSALVRPGRRPDCLQDFTNSVSFGEGDMCSNCCLKYQSIIVIQKILIKGCLKKISSLQTLKKFTLSNYCIRQVMAVATGLLYKYCELYRVVCECIMGCGVLKVYSDISSFQKYISVQSGKAT